MSEFAFFINEEYLKDNTPIDDNVDAKLLETAMREGQDIYIRDLIGSGLYNELCDQINASTAGTNDAVSADNIVLIKQYIQPCLKYYILYESADTMSFQVLNKGIQTRNSEFSNPADISTISALMAKWKDRGEYYATRLVKFLQENSSTYPLYLNPGNTIDTIEPRKTFLYGGFYLGPDSPECRTYDEPGK